jgi:hypothetical protein
LGQGFKLIIIVISTNRVCPRVQNQQSFSSRASRISNNPPAVARIHEIHRQRQITDAPPLNQLRNGKVGNA